MKQFGVGLRDLVLLVLMVVFIGCGEDEPDPVKPEEVDEVVDLVGNCLPGKSSLEKIASEKDGVEMTLIPAGCLLMGDHFDDGQNDEFPVHVVELDAFYMDVYEVTVGQFKQFVEETDHLPEVLRREREWNTINNPQLPALDLVWYWDRVNRYSEGDEHPIIWVSWHDAAAYAEWADKQLPTEAEWEYAARGGLIGKRYPWGDELTHDDANYEGTGGRDEWDESTAPVGSFPANGYGLYDMAGNVSEWCQDWYSQRYYRNSPLSNPQGPEMGPGRTVRGGWWIDHSEAEFILRVANRISHGQGGIQADSSGIEQGFRCAMDVP